MSSIGFCGSSGSQSQNKRKEKDRQVFGSCQRAEKVVEHEGDSDANCSWCSWNGSSRKEIRGNGDLEKNQDHPDSSIVKIYSNTQKSSGDLKGNTAFQIQ